MGYIYVIKNTKNDKVYVGKTIKLVHNRFMEHKYAASTGSDSKLHKAMRCIGIENFYTEVLGEYDNRELNKMEIYWIDKLDSFNSGYNSNKGGTSTGTNNDVIANTIVNLAKHGFTQREISDITNLPKSYIRKFYNFENNISKFEQTNKSKAIDMYNKHYLYIRSFQSIGEAYRFVSRNRSIDRGTFYNRVKEACNFDKIAFGYKWRYKGGNFEKEMKKEELKRIQLEQIKLNQIKIRQEQLAQKQLEKEETKRKQIEQKQLEMEQKELEQRQLKEEIIKQLNSGKNMEEIGRYFNVSSNAVRKWCKKLDIDRQKKKILLVELESIHDTWADAANHLINLGIAYYKDKYSLAYRLHKLYDNNKAYRGIHIKII